MNTTKIKVICAEKINTIINNIKIDNVKDQVYLGQRVAPGKENKDFEIDRRIRLD